TSQRTRAKRWFVLEIALRLIKRMELPASRCAVETSRNSRSAPETGIAKHRECGTELDVHSQSQARLSESASSTPLLLTIPATARPAQLLAEAVRGIDAHAPPAPPQSRAPPRWYRSADVAAG